MRVVELTHEMGDCKGSLVTDQVCRARVDSAYDCNRPDSLEQIYVRAGLMW